MINRIIFEIEKIVWIISVMSYISNNQISYRNVAISNSWNLDDILSFESISYKNEWNLFSNLFNILRIHFYFGDIFKYSLFFKLWILNKVALC